jgi:diguanylate cyclase (GGDEF)-like protein
MGSDFSSTIPFEDSRPPSPSPTVKEVDMLLPLQMPARKPRLLLVDDQVVHIQLLHHALGHDYQLFMASSGQQALKVCAAQHPDLIVLDLVMPDMDGFKVLHALKHNPATTDIPVIFVTGHEGEDIETRCLQAGAVDFITKPVNPSVVRARVKTHLTLKFQSDFLRDLAFMDGLTRVSNRRHFDERLSLEIGRAQRQLSPLSLVLLDVDFFKRYNDNYGHQAGDDCLRQIAATLKATLQRPTDLVARYGGEEFVCLLPDTGFDSAMRMAQKMLEAVRAQAITHDHSDVDRVVTVSLGVATKEPSPAVTRPNLLLALADTQLYRAKHMGRARVCGDRLAL